MVIECAYGMVKGRWRVLSRKAENQKDIVRTVTLACIVMHYICIEKEMLLIGHWDLSLDATSNLRRAGNELQDLIMIRQCPPPRDTTIVASKVRDYLKRKFLDEKQYMNGKND